MPPSPAPTPAGKAALRGRVVTMDSADTVLDDGIVYIDGAAIAAVRPAQAPAPDGFAAVAVVPTGGTVYPGLIELHNHLPYDVLPLWQVPKAYTNRSQWAGTAEYRRLVTGPMTVLGKDPLLMPAVVRYVEAKALVNGTTTSQGIALFSNTGARRMYQGLVRNVDHTGDPDLPAAASHIADVDAKDAARFLGQLRGHRHLLLHLAEGIDTAAREHFRALEYEPGKWAITDNLVGIHCTALTPADFRVLAGHGGSMVWSPLSNLLLYGRTADVAAAKAAGVRFGLGSDWSVSGSKGLIDEFKAARLTSAAAGSVFSDRELVAMATRDAAAILSWDSRLGSLQAGHYADLLVVAGTGGDPYAHLIDARDGDVVLVVIAGSARYGTAELMHTLVPDDRTESAGASAPPGHVVNLHDPEADPVVAGLTLADATTRLTAALDGLPQLAAASARHAARPGGAPAWRLALDEIAPDGVELRPRLPLSGSGGLPSGPIVAHLSAQGPTVLTAVALDELNATGDTEFLRRLAAEANLPEHFGAALAALLR